MTIPPGPKLVLGWVIALNLLTLLASVFLLVKNVTATRQAMRLLREAKALHDKAKRLAQEAMALRN